MSKAMNWSFDYHTTTERSILDASLGLEFISAGEYDKVLYIQTEITSWQQVKVESF